MSDEERKQLERLNRRLEKKQTVVELALALLEQCESMGLTYEDLERVTECALRKAKQNAIIRLRAEDA